MKFRNLRADEIDVRVGNCFNWGYTLLLYKDARCDMNILDETVGAENWQRDHKEVKGNLYCGVGIKKDTNDYCEFVWKWDCGVESNTEKEKGEASDSFKRACVNWGIGRELYTSPQIKIFCDMTVEKDKNGKEIYKQPQTEKYRKFNVKEIEYNDNKEITKLIICDTKGNVAFTTENNYINKNLSANKVEKEVVVGGKYIFNSGKHQGRSIEQVYKEDETYLEYLMSSDKVGKTIKDNIEKFLAEV